MSISPIPQVGISRVIGLLEVLDDAGLPRYSGSLHRYWFADDEKPERRITWVAATPDAPAHAAVRQAGELVPDGRPLVPFNPEGGLLHVRHLAPLPFDAYADLLSGRAWPGSRRRRAHR